ncbi:class I SAM-dependent methyltransferase [Lysobacter sp. KIS68-7]|uniref:class I SAM-dependent methyltransferase n=1 Tax=Lysobacter sp. KIS68-7 TaxID=2904252 RepID=UPI001E379AC6|nr:class I SAM-dependent methyltransferase [Lysobacter sp. KIS68-7]UHQ20008.1 class I SAM-dependent methyltransferase [Lysobacter sp. KIS68-7]
MSTAGGFRPEYFAELARTEANNFWFRARNDLIVDAIRRNFPGRRDFLEIGCGTGFVLSGIAQAFPDMALSGSELFPEGLPFAAARVPRARLMQMDARQIPYRGAFDLIGAFDVIEHIDDHVAVLKSMFDALAPGGGAMFTVPQHPQLWSRADDIACHVRRYRPGELEALLRDAGFRIVETTSFVTLLLPMLAASRLLGGRNKESHGAELELPRPLNAALYGVMQFERALIRMGLRFPWGGTRLVCAEKPA